MQKRHDAAGLMKSSTPIRGKVPTSNLTGVALAAILDDFKSDIACMFREELQKFSGLVKSVDQKCANLLTNSQQTSKTIKRLSEKVDVSNSH